MRLGLTDGFGVVLETGFTDAFGVGEGLGEGITEGLGEGISEGDGEGDACSPNTFEEGKKVFFKNIAEPMRINIRTPARSNVGLDGRVSDIMQEL